MLMHCCDDVRPIIATASALAMLGLAGCGWQHPATFGVEGVVRSSTGPVIERASVTFFSVGGERSYRAEGIVGAGGRFRLSTFRPGDGAVAGQHRVVIVPLPTADGPMQAARLIPPKYENPETSGLQVVIDPRPVNDVTLVIEP